MNQPLVTIVTPSFNQGRFIRETIESVFSQDYPHIEYIVMDGGSKDETADVVKEYAGRLTWISERDRGQSDAINKGFRMARGEIVAWLNSDDILLPGAVSQAVAAFERKPQMGAVYGEGYLIDIDSKVKGRFPYTQPMDLWRLTYLSDFILQQALFLRRTVLEELNYLDEGLHYTMDWDLLIRIASRYDVDYINAYLGAIREHGQAKTALGGLRRASEIRLMLQRHTGMRLSPGFLVYGVDTYQQVWCDWLATRIPHPARELLQRAVRTACSIVIGKAATGSQGLYADGWAGPRLRYVLQRGSGEVQVKGELPDLRGSLEGQTVTIHCGGRRVLRAALQNGPFTLTFSPPATDGPLHLEIRASRFVIPQAALGADDPRRISYIVHKIEWA
jgi:glycosyltransferase involved in cell wall biosynthesis